MDANGLKRKAVQIRKDLLQMIHHANTGHTGSSLSNTDILTALYYEIMRVDPDNPHWEDRDRFIASKGHAVESLYCILADKGFFPKDELTTYCRYGSRLIGHPNNKVPGIEMNTGALGHGLSIAVGMALAGKMDGKSYRVFALMGDGEQAEGSIWEAAMAAAHYKLDNLVGIIDRNKLQISGSTEDVMGLEPLEDKWRSFGWEVVPLNGNDMVELCGRLRGIPVNAGKPTLLMAYTTKGKGLAFAENVPHWHHHVPNEDQLAQAMAELNNELQVIGSE